jgi:hypothetical protein
MIPDCTVVTALYNLYKYNNKSLNVTELFEKINVVLELPVYIVIFTEKEFVEALKSKRKELGFSDITLIIEKNFEDLPNYQYLDKIKQNLNNYWPTKDNRMSAESHLIKCAKFDFVLNIIEENPFKTSKFSWLDALLGVNNKIRICENYTSDKFLNILYNITDKFHIQVLNVNDKKFQLDENKREYYSSYKYVVAGEFFTCGAEIGKKILTRLNQIFIKSTFLGFGHGEEMFFLEILDEFCDDIEKGYGDYGQIINNILIPTCNYEHIYYNIIKKYLDFNYYKECYDCCKKTLLGIEQLNSICEPSFYMEILFSYYVTVFYYKNDECLEVIKHIYDICNKNSNVKLYFDSNKVFYESQFQYTHGYNKQKYNKQKYKVIISIFGCVTKPKFKNEILKINETWGKRCEELGLKVLFFLGEEKTDLIDDKKYIYLKNVGNDYESASYKQNLGFKFIYENFEFDYIYTCGTDTYLNVDNLLVYLDTLDKAKYLYIGGHGDFRKIGDDYIYFHFGGGGITLTNSIIQKLYPKLDTIDNEWKQICISKNVNDLIPACDVLLAYYINKFNCEIIKNDNFYSCNYKGYSWNNTYRCCSDKIKIPDIISCHHMSLTEFDEYTTILKSNNYFFNYKTKQNLDYVKNKYDQLCNNYEYKSVDIYEHLPTLYKYASECESVFETGVRGVISSWAFSYGLLNNRKKKKQLFMNDILKCNNTELLENTKNTTLKIDYEWINNLHLEVKQNYDIVFIDTWHIYGQLKRELAKLSKYANKYIIMHDTTVDEIYGETIRNGWNAEQQSIESGFPIEEIKCGLWKAIDEFLVDNSEWKIKERYYNNNGLTILEKILYESQLQKLFPIGFSIPEEKITKIIPIKTNLISNLIPGKIETYIYNTELDYYNEYKKSLFAITTKKGGWDCIRHYEILANACIPYFPNIEQCPKNTMTLFPKDLILKGNKLYEKYNNKLLNELQNNEYNECISLIIELQDYTIKNLTTVSLAKYILEKTNYINISNILYLSGDTSPDYLRCLVLHGFKTIFGNNCHDYPIIPHIYKSNNISYNNLYGKGFSYTNLLDKKIHDNESDINIQSDIINKKYDIVIYGSYHRGMPFYDLVQQYYNPNEIILLCGEDLHNCNNHEFVNKGHFVFVREM